MNRNLFVYGTLKLTTTSRMGREQRARLAQEGKSLGRAIMQGRLFDLGHYPGLIDSASAGDCVTGEVVELADPANSLAWLDAYEGIEPSLTGASEYTREERAVVLQMTDGTTHRVIAWVYIYAGEISRGRLIESGLWGE